MTDLSQAFNLLFFVSKWIKDFHLTQSWPKQYKQSICWEEVFLEKIFLLDKKGKDKKEFSLVSLLVLDIVMSENFLTTTKSENDSYTVLPKNFYSAFNFKFKVISELKILFLFYSYLNFCKMPYIMMTLAVLFTWMTYLFSPTNFSFSSLVSILHLW